MNRNNLKDFLKSYINDWYLPIYIQINVHPYLV